MEDVLTVTLCDTAISPNACKQKKKKTLVAVVELTDVSVLLDF